MDTCFIIFIFYFFKLVLGLSSVIRARLKRVGVRAMRNLVVGQKTGSAGNRDRERQTCFGN